MCYSDFGESRDKWRIVFYRYPIKSGFKRRSRNAFIQGIKGVTVGGDSKVWVNYPIAFSTFAHPTGADLTGNRMTWSWSTSSGSLTGCNLVSTHDTRTMGVIAFGL